MVSHGSCFCVSAKFSGEESAQTLQSGMIRFKSIPADRYFLRKIRRKFSLRFPDQRILRLSKLLLLQVIVRVRPLNKKEESEEAIQVAHKLSPTSVCMADQQFTYDAVAGEDSSQVQTIRSS